MVLGLLPDIVHQQQQVLLLLLSEGQLPPKRIRLGGFPDHARGLLFTSGRGSAGRLGQGFAGDLPRIFIGSDII